MSDEASLLAYVYQHPEDDSARLVYADWLEEHGDIERADFIRVQVELAGVWESHPGKDDLEARVSELLRKNEARWCEALPAWARKMASFERGLPTHFKLSAKTLLKR